MNYYQPPRHEPQATADWLKKALGATEIVLGFAAAVAGCMKSVQRDDSLPGVGIVVSIVFGVFVLMLPGLLLFTRSRFAVLGQLVPALSVLFLLYWFFG